MNNQNKNLLTFLFGAAIGAAVAWLFTSEDGKKIVAETKEKVREAVVDLLKACGCYARASTRVWMK